MIGEGLGAWVLEVNVIFGQCGCEQPAARVEEMDWEEGGPPALPLLCPPRPGPPAFPAWPGLATAKTDGGLVESTPCGGRPPIPHHTGGAQGHALGVWLGPEGLRVQGVKTHKGAVGGWAGRASQRLLSRQLPWCQG